ncbi:uncharacterized protein [Pseudorasbora parva]|uniref:uncharacterized protein n=1 Tax=Pseudorasbora parva TaxID=51549 RepID=UPI00351F1DB1
MNIRPTDSGKYQVEISSRHSERIFNVTVRNVPASELDKIKKKEGESVTLDSGGVKNTNDVMAWYFTDVLIAEITGDQSQICTDDQCKERFRDRLKLDHQTGALTITHTRHTDSGEYKLQFNSSKFSIIRSFSVSVTGVSGADQVPVNEGDSVTLNSSVVMKQQDRMKWYFNDTRLAEITGNLSKICTDVQCKNGDERFRGRLKLDHQTGSLTITDTTTEDSGLYKLQINSRNMERVFNVAVTAVPGSYEPPEESSAAVISVGAAVGIGFGVVLLLVLAAAGVIYYRHRRSSQARQNGNRKQGSNTQENDVPKEEMPLNNLESDNVK